MKRQVRNFVVAGAVALSLGAGALSAPNAPRDPNGPQ